MDLRDLTADNTRPHIGTTFTLELGEGKTVPFVLDRVVVLLEHHLSKRAKRDAFGLYFIGPPNFYLPQGLYQTRHESMDEPVGIFYVPISKREDGGYEFEAVFT